MVKEGRDVYGLTGYLCDVLLCAYCLTFLNLIMREVVVPEREFDAGVHLAFEKVSVNSLVVWMLLTVSL